MLTGAVPFDGDSTAEVLTQHIQSSPPSPRERRPDTPDYVENVVLMALAKAPAERFPTVYRLVEALREGERSAPRRTGSMPPEPPDAPEPEASSPSLSAPGPASQLAEAMAAEPPSSPALVALPAAPRQQISEKVSQQVRKKAGQTAIIKVNTTAPPSMTQEWFAEGDNLADAAGGSSAELPAAAPERKRMRTERVAPISYPSTDNLPAARKSPMPWIILGILAILGATIAVLFLLPAKKKKAPLASASPSAPAPVPVPVPVPVSDPSPSPPPSASVSASVSPSASASASASPSASAPPSPSPSAASRPRPSSSPRPSSGGLPALLTPRPSPSASAAPPPGSDAAQAEAAIQRGRDALAAGNAAEASDQFTQARRFDPGNTEAIIGMGEVALLQGKPSEAAVHLGEAARRRPRSGRIQRLLAKALELAGDTAGAEAARKRAQALDRVP